MNFKDSGGDSFRQFAGDLTAILEIYGKMEDKQLLQLQRNQLEKLMDLEYQFKKTLIKHRWGENVYRRFVNYICVERGNILCSRPYFRERQTVCTGPISKALDEKKHKELYRFNFNFLFVQFAMNCFKWGKNSKIRKLSTAIKKARKDIVELNMPLAISQARVFWSKAPAKTAYCHSTFMDFVQIGADGLLSAVDKFVAPDPKVFTDKKELHEEWRRFRPMAVQRMVGNYIEDFSSTPVHFYPKQKRMLYRAHKYIGRNSGAVLDFDKVTLAVNRDAKGRHIPAAARTTSSEIGLLLSAASSLGPSETSGTINEDGTRDNPLERYSDEVSSQPDVQYESTEVGFQMRVAIAQLPILDRKLLRLKGIGL